jgi:hypothetical protein
MYFFRRIQSLKDSLVNIVTLREHLYRFSIHCLSVRNPFSFVAGTASCGVDTNLFKQVDLIPEQFVRPGFYLRAIPDRRK